MFVLTLTNNPEEGLRTHVMHEPQSKTVCKTPRPAILKGKAYELGQAGMAGKTLQVTNAHAWLRVSSRLQALPDVCHARQRQRVWEGAACYAATRLIRNDAATLDDPFKPQHRHALLLRHCKQLPTHVFSTLLMDSQACDTAFPIRSVCLKHTPDKHSLQRR